MNTLRACCRIEFLTHDINVHVPHHVSSKIPWYNLRRATDSLRENWGEVSPACPCSGPAAGLLQTCVAKMMSSAAALSSCPVQLHTEIAMVMLYCFLLHAICPAVKQAALILCHLWALWAGAWPALSWGFECLNTHS